MGRPSMFSRNYEQQLKQRKINIFLVVLIILCGAFFGGKYYLNKYNIKIFDFTKNNSIANNQNNKKASDSKKQTDKTKKNDQSTNKTDNTQQNNQTTPSELSYDYKTSDGSAIKVYYTDDNGTKTITRLDAGGSKVTSDISADKKSIVFDDIKAGSIVLGDADGNFKSIEVQSYTSKSAGITIEKSKTMSSNPDYIWAAMPHFTGDGRVIYVTSLPYVYKGADLSIWAVAADGSSYKMMGQLTTSDISQVSFDGTESDGRIRIKSASDIFYLAPDGSNLTQ